MAAVEVLLGTQTIQDLVMKGDIHGIKEIMAKSENLGMQTFDAALFKLHSAGRISQQEALKNADSENNLRLRIKLAGGTSKNSETNNDFSLAGSEAEEEEFA